MNGSVPNQFLPENQSGEVSAVVTLSILKDPSVKHWIGGIEPVWFSREPSTVLKSVRRDFHPSAISTALLSAKVANCTIGRWEATKASTPPTSSWMWRSLKYEDIYLKHYADGREAREGIASWIAFYNGRRPHQALGYRTPMSVWREATTGPLGEKAVNMTLRLDNAKGVVHMPTAAAAVLAA